MASLYATSVASYLQTLDAVSGYLAKGRAHCEAHGIDLGAVVETSLYEDMLMSFLRPEPMNPRNIRPHIRELALHVLVTAIEVIHAPHDRLAVRDQSRNHQ